MFEIMEVPSQKAVIKVIGVGGCGGNAVDHMMGYGVKGVEFRSWWSAHKPRSSVRLRGGLALTTRLSRRSVTKQRPGMP